MHDVNASFSISISLFVALINQTNFWKLGDFAQ